MFRNRRIEVRVSDEERELIAAAARAAERSVSDFMRFAALTLGASSKVTLVEVASSRASEGGRGEPIEMPTGGGPVVIAEAEQAPAADASVEEAPLPRVARRHWAP